MSPDPSWELDPTDPFPTPVPEGVRLVGVQWVDVHGATKAKLVPRRAYDEMVTDGGGAGFAGFANDGFARGPEHPELLAIPDPSTLLQLPHRPGMAVVMSTILDGEHVATCDSRSILARVQREAASKGFAPVVGMEPEFFLLHRNEDGTLRPYDQLDQLGKPCYDYKSLLRAAPLLGEIVDAMTSLDWGVSAIDHEDGSGQYEINFGHASALRTADRFTLLRTMISDIATANGAIASFMPKPLAGSTGSGAHVHLSALDARGNNAFDDPEDPRGLGLSQDGYAFIAGVLDHAPGLAALTMPTVNSYKRLYSGGGSSGHTWAPGAIVFGGNNRTAMVRVPAPGRIENRAVDSSCNPYLALAGMIVAGLDGIERGLDPGKPIEGRSQSLGAKMLPRTLAEAVDALELDVALRDGLGEEAMAEFVVVKREEWGLYMDQVSSWEHATYLERL